MNGLGYLGGGTETVDEDGSAEVGAVEMATETDAARMGVWVAQMTYLPARILAEPEVTDATLGGEHGQLQQQQRRKTQAEAELGVKGSEDVKKVPVLLVIAVVTIRARGGRSYVNCG